MVVIFKPVILVKTEQNNDSSSGHDLVQLHVLQSELNEQTPELMRHLVQKKETS